MGIFDAVGTLVGGVANTASHATKAVVDTTRLEPVDVVEDVANTVGSAVDTVFGTIGSLFD